MGWAAWVRRRGGAEHRQGVDGAFRTDPQIYGEVRREGLEDESSLAQVPGAD